MPARVPKQQSVLSYEGARVAQPVRAADWGVIADAFNYTLGRGQPIIPAYCPESGVVTKGTTLTFRNTIWPRYAATHRLWVVSVTAVSTCILTFTSPSGAATTWTQAASVDSSTPRAQLIVETITSRTVAETQISWTLVNSLSSATSVTVNSVACYELPRGTMPSTAAELGIDGDTLRPQLPIFDGTTLGQSVGAIASRMATLRDETNRGSVFQHARASGGGISTTSGAYVSLFAADPTFQARHLYNGTILGKIELRAYIKTGAATTGNIRFTMASGASIVTAIPTSVAGAWLNCGAIDANTFDLTRTYGLRGGVRDACSIQFQRTAGVNSVTVETISCGQAA